MTINFNSHWSSTFYIFMATAINTTIPFYLFSVGAGPTGVPGRCLPGILLSIFAALFSRSLPLAFFLTATSFYLKKRSHSFATIIRAAFLVNLVINSTIAFTIRNTLHLKGGGSVTMALIAATLSGMYLSGIIAQNAVSYPDREPQEVYFSDLSK